MSDVELKLINQTNSILNIYDNYSSAYNSLKEKKQCEGTAYVKENVYIYSNCSLRNDCKVVGILDQDFKIKDLLDLCNGIVIVINNYFDEKVLDTQMDEIQTLNTEIKKCMHSFDNLAILFLGELEDKTIILDAYEYLMNNIKNLPQINIGSIHDRDYYYDLYEIVDTKKRDALIKEANLKVIATNPVRDICTSANHAYNRLRQQLIKDRHIFLNVDCKLNAIKPYGFIRDIKENESLENFVDLCSGITFVINISYFSSLDDLDKMITLFNDDLWLLEKVSSSFNKLKIDVLFITSSLKQNENKAKEKLIKFYNSYAKNISNKYLATIGLHFTDYKKETFIQYEVRKIVDFNIIKVNEKDILNNKLIFKEHNRLSDICNSFTQANNIITSNSSSTFIRIKIDIDKCNKEIEKINPGFFDDTPTLDNVLTKCHYNNFALILVINVDNLEKPLQTLYKNLLSIKIVNRCLHSYMKNENFEILFLGKNKEKVVTTCDEYYKSSNNKYPATIGIILDDNIHYNEYNYNKYYNLNASDK